MSCANVVEHAGAPAGARRLRARDRPDRPRPRRVAGHVADARRDAGAPRRASRSTSTPSTRSATATGSPWSRTPRTRSARAGRAGRSASHGNLTAFSFHATKNITTFEGGALVVPADAAAERAGRLSLHGLSRSAWARHGSTGPAAYEVAEPGFKFSMNDISAAVGIHQLAPPRRLDRAPRRARRPLRRGAARTSRSSCRRGRRPTPATRTTSTSCGCGTSAAPTATAVIARMQDAQIGCTVHFKAIHLYDHYRSTLRPAPPTTCRSPPACRRPSLSLPAVPGDDRGRRRRTSPPRSTRLARLTMVRVLPHRSSRSALPSG